VEYFSSLLGATPVSNGELVSNLGRKKLSDEYRTMCRRKESKRKWKAALISRFTAARIIQVRNAP
jgi:hypothetical protein